MERYRWRSFGQWHDYRNRLVRFTDEEGVVTTFRYDALGRRIEKVADAEGQSPEVMRYFHAGWRVVEERDGASSTVATWVYGKYVDEVLTMRRVVPPGTPGHPGGGNPELADYWYHADDQHSVVAITDAVGGVVERYEYNDYGQPLLFDSSGTPLTASAVGNVVMFTGRWYDAETGLYEYRTRYLDPTSGRFITRDPIGTWGDPVNLGNAYTYAGNNPWTFVDPFGLQSATGRFALGSDARFEQRHTQLRPGEIHRSVSAARNTPWSIIKAGGRSLYDSGAGMVSGVYHLATDPFGVAAGIAESASTTYSGFREFGAGGFEAAFHTAAAGAASTLGGGGILDGYEAVLSGDYEGAAAGFASAGGDIALSVAGGGACKSAGAAGRAGRSTTSRPRVTPYEVGRANDLRARSARGDKLDIHHVGQAHPMESLVSNYNRTTAPAIVLPRAEHAAIRTIRGRVIGTARGELARSIRNLRNLTNAPSNALRELIELNKRIYPDAFKKRNR